jgi:cytochrome c oxidase subunit 2
MPIVVEVVSKDDYAKWLAAKKAAQQQAQAPGAPAPAATALNAAPAATTASL